MYCHIAQPKATYSPVSVMLHQQNTTYGAFRTIYQSHSGKKNYRILRHHLAHTISLMLVSTTGTYISLRRTAVF